MVYPGWLLLLFLLGTADPSFFDEQASNHPIMIDGKTPHTQLNTIHSPIQVFHW
jgi:hypothetical protein